MDKPPACRILCVFYILCLNFFWSQIRICPDMKIFDLTLLLKLQLSAFSVHNKFGNFVECWLCPILVVKGLRSCETWVQAPNRFPSPCLHPQSCPQVDWSDLVKHCGLSAHAQSWCNQANPNNKPLIVPKIPWNNFPQNSLSRKTRLQVKFNNTCSVKRGH